MGDDLPELEDMSDALAASRQARLAPSACLVKISHCSGSIQKVTAEAAASASMIEEVQQGQPQKVAAASKDAFGGFKAGFLSAKPKPKNQPTPKARTEPVIKPSGKEGGVLHDLKNLGISQDSVPGLGSFTPFTCQNG